MSVLEDIHSMVFWSNWLDKFENNSERYITPNTRLVQKEVDKANIDMDDTDFDKAISIWSHVYNEINYELSKYWKPPDETISSRIGDCEDVTFLMASMYPNVGIERSKIGLGYIIFNDGREEQHTWNIVDGNIMDATGSIEVVRSLEYEKVDEITIMAENTQEVTTNA